MIIIGCVLTIIFSILLIGDIIEKEGLAVTSFLCLFVIIFGIILWSGDVNSPTEVTEKVILTNDYRKYGIQIDNKNLGEIKVITTEATNFGAIWNDGVEYEFIDFIE